LETGELSFGAFAGLEPDGEVAFQEDEDGVDGYPLPDERLSGVDRTLAAGFEHPFDVVVIQLAEEEEDFSHGCSCSEDLALDEAGEGASSTGEVLVGALLDDPAGVEDV